MASTQAPVNIAILDDYQNVALKLADWSRLQGRSQVTCSTIMFLILPRSSSA
jgi:hypothetical protein